MSMESICLGCMNPLPEGSDRCSICGFTAEDRNPAEALALATRLQENYVVGRLLRTGSDSLTYLGYNRLLKEPCLIREYFPAGLAQRAADGTVSAAPGSERVFADYRIAFHSSVRSLARVKDLPTVIPIYDIFEENGTVYAVSDYVEGITLARKIKQAGGRLSWQEAKPLFMSLSNGLEQLHLAHIYHLAICPENILVNSDGKVHFRNFGLPEARFAGSDLKPELAAGYAAPEQYRPMEVVTDATDVYGLAATLFSTVTGNVPPAGNKRVKNSDDLFMSAEVAEELSQPVCSTLFNALLVSPEQRTATVEDFREQLGLEPNVSALRNEARQDRAMEQETQPESKAKVPVWLIIVITVLAAVLLFGGGALLLRHNRQQPDTSADTSVTLPPISTTSQTKKPEKQYSVPNFVGKKYYEIDADKLDGGMKIAVKYKQYSKKDADIVLEQEPAAGSGAGKDTTVYLIVSCGSEELTVPDVSGWKEAHAKLYLEALGFRVDVSYLQSSKMDKGLVEDTDPVAGTKKKVGDTITLRVSNVEQIPDDNDNGYATLD